MKQDKSTVSASVPKQKAAKRRLGIFMLEPRVMYDGAAAGSAHHVDHHGAGWEAHGDVATYLATTPIAATPAPSNVASNPQHHWDKQNDASNTGYQNPNAGKSVVFVDSQIANYQAIVAAINPGVQVFVYDGTQDGLAQIAQDLQGMHGLASIDIISHGSSQAVELGTDALTTGNLANYSTELAAIGNALAPNGQIDLYGCDIAAGGDGFIDALQQATGRNVAASTVPVGASTLGGTWTLDASTGPAPDALPANLAALQSFDNLLVDVPAIMENNAGATTNGNGQPIDYITVNGVATDSAGDLFVTGTFDGTVNFGGTDRTSSAGTVGDAFLAEYSSTGTLDWVDDLGGTSNGYTFAGESIAVTSNGSEVYIAGNFDGTIDFDGTHHAAEANGQSEAFVAQYSGSGAFNWALLSYGSASGTGASFGTNSLALDSNGTVVAAMNFSSYNNQAPGATTYLVSLYPTTGPSVTLPVSEGDTQANNAGTVIFDLNSSGALQWHATGIDQSGAAEYPTALATDSSGNIYLAGNFIQAKFTSANGSTSTLDAPTYTITANGKQYQVSNYASFLAEINSSGNFVWTTEIASNNLDSNSIFQPDIINGIAIDSTGVVITGSYQDDTTIDGRTLSTHTWRSSGGSSTSIYASTRVFVEQLSASGSPGWLVTESDNGQKGQDTASNIVVDGSGDIVVTGTIESPSATADNFDGKSITPPNTYRAEAFVWDLTPGSSSATVNFLGAFTSGNYDTIGGLVSGSSGVALALNIAASVSGEATVSDTSNFDAGALIDLTSSDLHEGPTEVAPTVTAGSTATFDGGGSAATLDSGLTITAGSSTTLSSATVTISGYISGDTLNFTAQNGITVASNTGGVLTLTGTATVAQYQAALDSITYSFSSNGDPTSGGGDTTRTISWSVNDGTASSTAATSTLNTVHVAPTVTASGTATFTGGGSAATLDSGLTLGDVDSGGNLTGATVSISSGYVSGDTLNFTAQNGITIASNSGGVLTLHGTATVAQYQAALQSITYGFTANGDPTNGGADTTRTISWKVTDASTSNGTSNTATSTLDTVHVAPVVTPSGSTATYDTGTAAVALDSGLSLSDVDSGGNLTGATVKIGTGYDSGDALTFTNQNGITGSYSAGTLTLTGTASVANYIAALESITFSTTATSSGSRTIDWKVSDAASTSSQATSTIDVVAGPLVTGVSALSGTEGIASGSETVATFTDSGVASPTTSDFTATIAWGDGTTAAGAIVSQGGGVFAVTGPAHTYADEGSYTIGVYVTDSNTNTGSANDSASIADAALTAGTVSVSGGVEGTTAATLTAAFTDANTGAPTTDFSGTIAWGDGTTSTFTSADVSGTNGSYTVSGSHTYAEEGNYTASVTINDDGGSTVSESNSTTVADAALTAGAVSVSGGVEGATAATLSAAFTDANTGATPSDFSGTIAWGDGTTSTFTSANVTGTNGSYTVNGSHTYAEEGNYTASVTINDDGGSTVTEGNSTTVADAALTAGTVSVTGGVEGTTAATLSAAFTDANTGAPTTDFSGTIAWGDGTTTNFTSADVSGTNGSYTVSGSHTYAEEGNYTASVTINDDGGSTVTEGNSTTVADAALTAGTVSVTGGIEGTTAATLSAAFTDANAGAPTTDFSGTIAWGDGTSTNFTSANVTGSAGAYTVNGSHTYAEEGNYTASVTINDDGGSTVSEGNSTTVADAALTAGTVSVSGGVEGTTAATLAAAFTDANTGAPTTDFSGTIAWGDGTSTNFTSADVSGTNGSYTVNGSHTYAEEGNYTASVTINDDGGSSKTETGGTTVADAALTAGTVSVTGGIEGTTAATLSAAFTDANTGAPTTDFSGTIAWGDGTTSTFTSANVSGTNGSYTVNGSHTYAEEGNYTASVTINDDGGSSKTETGGTTVADAALTAGTVNVTGAVGGTTAATLTAAFTDANTGATPSDFSGTINWGDGTTTNFTSANVSGTAGAYTVSGSHLYALSGNYTASVTINDDGGSTATDSGSASVAHAPPVVTASGTVTFTGGGSAVTLDSGLTVSDPDSSGNLSGATVSISTGYISGDTLNFTAQNGITIASNTGGVLTLHGTASIADYQAALDSITYSFAPSNGDPTHGGADTARTISWTVTDGNVSNGTSNTGTTALDTVHVAPVVTASGTVTFTGGGAAVALDSGLTLSDVDSGGNLTGATVSITSGLAPNDRLNFTNTANITGSYNAATGVLTLSGTDTVADYQAALQSITYSTPANGDPTHGGADTTRTISWSVTDGSSSHGTSNTGTTTLDTVHVAPSVTAGGSQTFTGGGSAVALDTGLTVSDVDSDGNLTGATVSISTGYISGDTLNFTAQNGITIASNTGGVLTLQGTATVAQYQAALDSITYSFTPANGDPTGGGADTARTISWTVTDGSSSHGTSATATSSLTTVHVAPVVTASGTVTFTGGGAAVALDSGLTLSDVDSGGNLTGATVSITSGLAPDDRLNFTNTANITGSYNAATGVLTLSGTDTVADYQAALQSITYSTPLNGDPTHGGADTTRTISWTVTDGSSSHGTSNTGTTALDTVHVAPSVTAGGSQTFAGGGSPQPLDSGLTVSDVDSDGNLTGATVSISAGFLNGDTLSFVNQNGITGSFNAATGVLTLTGTASVASYQAALQSIAYGFAPSNGDPTGGGADTARTISWTVTDGSSSHGTSATATSSLTTVHGAPSVSAGAAVSYDANQSVAAVLDPTIAVSDPDSGGMLTGATVTISAGSTPNDALHFTNEFGITGSYNAATGVLTLTGTATVAQYQAALQSVTFTSNTLLNSPRTITWTVNDGNLANNLSAPVTSSLNVTGVLLPPVQPAPAPPPPPPSPLGAPPPPPDNGDADIVTNIIVPTPPLDTLDTGTGDNGLAGVNPAAGGTPFVFVNVTPQTIVNANSNIEVQLPLSALEGPLSGNITSISAELPDGSALPSWLQFDPTTGIFTGTVPPGASGTLTIEVMVKDGNGNETVATFTIDLSAVARGSAALELNWREASAFLPQERPSLTGWHRGERHAPPAPAGRAGLSQQLGAIGWKSLAADRQALLDSLRQAAG